MSSYKQREKNSVNVLSIVFEKDSEVENILDFLEIREVKEVIKKLSRTKFLKDENVVEKIDFLNNFLCVTTFDKGKEIVPPELVVQTDLPKDSLPFNVFALYVWMANKFLNVKENEYPVINHNNNKIYILNYFPESQNSNDRVFVNKKDGLIYLRESEITYFQKFDKEFTSNWMRSQDLFKELNRLFSNFSNEKEQNGVYINKDIDVYINKTLSQDMYKSDFFINPFDMNVLHKSELKNLLSKICVKKEVIKIWEKDSLSLVDINFNFKEIKKFFNHEDDKKLIDESKNLFCKIYKKNISDLLKDDYSKEEFDDYEFDDYELEDKKRSAEYLESDYGYIENSYEEDSDYEENNHDEYDSLNFSDENNKKTSKTKKKY